MQANSWRKVLIAAVVTLAMVLDLAMPYPAFSVEEELDEAIATNEAANEENDEAATIPAMTKDTELEESVADDGSSASNGTSQVVEPAPTSEIEGEPDSSSSAEGPAEGTEPSSETDPARNQELEAQDDVPLAAEVAAESDEAVVGAQPEEPALAPEIKGSAYFKRYKWRSASAKASEVLMLGFSRKSLGMEGIRLKVAGGSVSYKARIQDTGWEGSWASDGSKAGRPGKSKLMEAVRIQLSQELVEAGWSVQYRAKAQKFGWLGWAADGSEAGTAGYGYRLEALEVRVVSAGTALPKGGGAAFRDGAAGARAYVQGKGWQKRKMGRKVTVGTTGKSLRLEALRIYRPGVDCSGKVVYSARVQGSGWQKEKRNGAAAGTVGRSKRLEAVRVRLTGELAKRFDVWYRVYVQGVGWMAWTSNGEDAGTEGISLRAEAVQVAFVNKGKPAPSAKKQGSPYPFVGNGDKGTVSYAAHASGSWSGWATNGGTLGSSSGAAFKRLRMQVSDGLTGSVRYSTYDAKNGWTSYVKGGAASEGSGVQAVRVKLSGQVSKFYNVWYRAYVQGVSWMGWAKNGAKAGSVGVSKPMVALQVMLRSKGEGAPGATGTPLYTGAQALSKANARQLRLVRAAESTPWPGPGLCAGWVEDVYYNAGFGYFWGNACDLYDMYCKSSDINQLKVGMIIAVRTHTRTSAGSIWGHVGVYVGDGWVMHSVTGGVKRMSLKDWIEFYGTTYTPKWGWLGNVNIA